MGFDFSAVTALLGGYAPSRKRHHGSDDELKRYPRRGDDAFAHAAAGRQEMGDGASGDGPTTPRHDGPPVTGAAAGAPSGIGRALDALISAEETRRRKTGDGDAPAATTSAPLSTVLKASLPERKALSERALDDADDRVVPARRESERNWDEIRELIEALGRAERPAEIVTKEDIGIVKPAEVRPWRPKIAS